MKTVFVEAWDISYVGDRTHRFVNPHLVTHISPSDAMPEQCMLTFVGGKVMVIEGSLQKTMLDFADATAES